MIRIEIEHLWAQRKIHEDLITQLEDFARAIIAARDEELRKQEPFGYWHEGDTEDESDFRLASDIGGDCIFCIPLYKHAAPIPPTEGG